MAKYLAIIFAVAVIFRFWQLTSYPVSLMMDEVTIGYTSYSLLKTGRDDWGQIFPLAFRSVGDYKPPVNFYLNVPSVFTFGLSEFAVRFPVALLGSLSAILFVIFLRRLGLSGKTAYFSGFWLAILPWHVHYSRYGLEAVTALFFLLLGAACFQTALAKKSHTWLTPAVFGFGLSVWAYHSNRFFVPLLVMALTMINFSRFRLLLRPVKKIILPVAVLLVIAIPFVYLALTSPAIKQRAAMTSILREQSLLKTLHHGQYSGPAEKVFANDAYLIFHHWVGKYTDYFDLRFWFWKGLGFTPPGYPDSGLLYLVDVVMFIPGILVFINLKNKAIKYLLAFWFFIGPMASSFTMNDQHTLRTLVWLPFFGIIIGMGFDYLSSRFGRKIHYIYAALLAINIMFVFDLYTRQFPRYFSEAYQYGFKQASVYACEHLSEYERINISPVFGSLGPLMTGIPDYYVLFYCKYPPAEYMYTKKIDKFDFIRVDWRKELQTNLRTLLISAKWDYPYVTAPEESVIKRIDYFDESPAFYFVDTYKNRPR